MVSVPPPWYPIRAVAVLLRVFANRSDHYGPPIRMLGLLAFLLLVMWSKRRPQHCHLDSFVTGPKNMRSFVDGHPQGDSDMIDERLWESSGGGEAAFPNWTAARQNHFRHLARRAATRTHLGSKLPKLALTAHSLENLLRKQNAEAIQTLLPWTSSCRSFHVRMFSCSNTCAVFNSNNGSTLTSCFPHSRPHSVMGMSH